MPHLREENPGSREMVETDLDKIRRYFIEKFKEMDIDPKDLKNESQKYKMIARGDTKD
jgi:hypothetical protein